MEGRGRKVVGGERSAAEGSGECLSSSNRGCKAILRLGRRVGSNRGDDLVPDEEDVEQVKEGQGGHLLDQVPDVKRAVDGDNEVVERGAETEKV
ncbi:hypothetical protein Pyn_39779 [Prunus yedoensis var. nudiflora]|uniref:Uncharacterized protein n=1 Tax=Prunus yedoensis var. nudiflora TaxID=2094558 RepID=A0A314XEZ1_PRUYE|nr:hypothetical protein Pyn_39779 [Prunus yedoensis var. nudiflora]